MSAWTPASDSSMLVSSFVPAAVRLAPLHRPDGSVSWNPLGWPIFAVAYLLRLPEVEGRGQGVVSPMPSPQSPATQALEDGAHGLEPAGDRPTSLIPEEGLESSRTRQTLVKGSGGSGTSESAMPVPEPGVLVLVGSSILGLAYLTRKRGA